MTFLPILIIFCNKYLGINIFKNFDIFVIHMKYKIMKICLKFNVQKDNFVDKKL